MKKKYGILLCIVFLATACSSDQSSPQLEDQQIPSTNTYEAITNAYHQKQEHSSALTSFGFWGWAKKIATIDAKAAAAYAVKHGMKSDWKEALLIGAAASVEALLTGNSARITSTTTPESPSSDVLVLSEITQIKSAAYTQNFMDNLGYIHYVLVNEVLKDPAILQLVIKDTQGTFREKIYDNVYSQAQKLGIQAIYDKQEAVMLLNQIENTTADKHKTCYRQLFSFKSQKDQTDFKAIDELYNRALNTIKNTAIFTDYSKEMETAVLQDETLSQTVKEILLLEMATYRYGFTYYTSGF